MGASLRHLVCDETTLRLSGCSLGAFFVGACIRPVLDPALSDDRCIAWGRARLSQAPATVSVFYYVGARGQGAQR